MSVRGGMTPRQAKTFMQICSLNCDNYDLKEGWIMVGIDDVTLCTQCNGKASTGIVTFSRQSFNRLIDWYHREQKVKS